MNETFTPGELRDLRRAKSLLENRSFAIKLSDLFGMPINAGFALLPKKWSGKINRAANAALFKALEVAVATTGRKGLKSPSNRWHKLLAGASGGVGGAFGLAALAVELPISTTIMLRSIVEIARSEGHDVRDWATKVACLEVFALGGSKKAADPPETPYWSTRLALNQSVKEAASHLARKGTVERTAPGARAIRRGRWLALRSCHFRGSGGQGAACHRRGWRRSHQRDFYEPLSTNGARPLHCPAPGKNSRPGGCQGTI